MLAWERDKEGRHVFGVYKIQRCESRSQVSWAITKDGKLVTDRPRLREAKTYVERLTFKWRCKACTSFFPRKIAHTCKGGHWSVEKGWEAVAV